MTSPIPDDIMAKAREAINEMEASGFDGYTADDQPAIEIIGRRILAERTACKERVERLEAERDKWIRQAGKHFAKECELADRAINAEDAIGILRSDWHGVFLDGRNEHGSHVLNLPQRSIELEQDSEGYFLREDAEAILRDAESKGFRAGDHAVVVSFVRCTDEGWFSHYEVVGVSPELTKLIYGTADEQDAEARALLKEHGNG